MAFSLPKELLVKIGGDARNLQRAGRTSVSVLNRVGNEAKQIATKVAKIGAASALVGFAIKRAFLDPFAQSQDALAALGAALNATGKIGVEALRAIADEASRLQRITTVGDEVMVKAAATLATLAPSLKTDELVRAQTALVGLAEIMGTDVNGAAALLGKTLGSSTNALSRYGIELDASASASEKLAKILGSGSLGAAFDVAQAKALTFAGRMAQIANASGDVRETIGEVIIRTIDLTGEAGTLSERLLTLNQQIQDNMAQWVAWGDVVVRGFEFAGAGIGGLFRIAFNVGEVIGRVLDIIVWRMVGLFKEGFDNIKKLANELIEGLNAIPLIPNIEFRFAIDETNRFFDNAAKQAAALKGDIADIDKAVLGIGGGAVLFEEALNRARAASGGIALLIPPSAAAPGTPDGPPDVVGAAALRAEMVGERVFLSSLYRPFAFGGIGLAAGATRASPLTLGARGELPNIFAGAAGGPLAIGGGGGVPRIFAEAASQLRPLVGAAQDAAAGWSVASDTLASSIAHAAQATISGGQQISSAVVGMMQNIIANIGTSSGGLFGSTLSGALIGGALGIIGGLFSRRDRTPVKVHLDKVSPEAARDLEQTQGPTVVNIQVLSPGGDVIDEFRYETARRERMDQTVRLPSMARRGF